MTRIYLSPPEVGAEERRMLLEAFDSNWIAPLGPDVDAFERELADAGRRRRTPWPCPAAPPPSTSPCCWSGWGRATRCSSPPSPSWPPPPP